MTTYKVTQGFTSTKPYVVVPNAPGRWTWQGAPATINSTATGGGSTVQHGVAITFASPGSGTKSDHTTPGVFDYGFDAAYGATSAQWTATGSKLPLAGGGNYNIQNQPPGFSPSGWFIAPVNPFIMAVISGCHYPNSGNDGNGVYLGYAWTPPNNGTVTTYPFLSVGEYDYTYDPNMFNDPQTDNNTKTMEIGDTQSVYGGSPPPGGQYLYVEPSPITQFPISAITKANPCVITSPYNSAVAPAAIGNVVTLFGIEGMVQINGMAATVTNVTGGFGAWVITLGALDTSGSNFSAYASSYTIAAATATSPVVITLANATANHPLGATNRDWVWVTGAAGGSWTNLNQFLPMAAAVGLGGSSGAWTAQLVVGFATGTSVNGGSWGTYTPNSATLHTGGFSVAFSVLGAANAANQYITTRGWDINPIDQLQGPPDANGVGGGTAYSATGGPLNMPSAPTGLNVQWKRRRWEMCWSQTVGSPGATGPGYLRIYDNNVLKWNYIGQGDNLSPQGFFKQMAMGSVYHRDRGINNYCHFANPYYDWGIGGGAGPETGQVYRVYAGDASTYAACGLLVPQPFLGTITNLSVPLTKFWQGGHADGATVYFYATPENSAPGTAVQLNVAGNTAFTITPVAKPTIATTTVTAPAVGVAYNSGAIPASAGTAPYTYYLASAATGGGYNAQPSRNTWAVNSATGAITGTPAFADTDSIVLTVIDANGYNFARQLTLAVSGAQFAPNRPFGLSTLFDRQWAATDLPGGTMPHTDGYGMTWQTTGGPLGPFLGTPAQVLTQTGLTVPLPPDGGGAAGSMLVYQYQSGQTAGSCPFEVFWPGTFSYQTMYVSCYVFVPSTFNANTNNIKWMDVEQHQGTGSANHITMLISNGAGQVNAGGLQDYRAAWVTLQGGVNNNYGGSNSDAAMYKQLNPGGGFVSSQGSGPGWWTTSGNNGVWVQLEWLLTQESTAGVSSDGTIRTYWNGTLINQDTNVRWNAAGDPNCFNVALLNAYYGGGGSAAPSNQYLMVGRFMVAGA